MRSDTTGKPLLRFMKKLQESNFIKRVQNGVWLVNPNILMKGNDTKRQILMSYYQNDNPVDEITFNRAKQKEIDSITPDTNIELLEGDIDDQQS